MSTVLEGLLVGLISGVISGGIVSFWLQRYWRPRVRSWCFIKTSFVPNPQVSGSRTPIGELIKLRFRVEGKTSPEFCALEITWVAPGHEATSVFAKWDEKPMPIEAHDMDSFRPELVPDTYFQPLIIGRVYDVPVLFCSADGQVDVFSGWWFGRKKGYKRVALEIPKNTKLTLSLIGGGGLERVIETSAGEMLEKATDGRSAGDLQPQTRRQEELELRSSPGVKGPGHSSG